MVAGVLLSNVGCVDRSKPAPASPVGTGLTRTVRGVHAVLVLATREGEHDLDRTLDEPGGLAIEPLGVLLPVDGNPWELLEQFCT